MNDKPLSDSQKRMGRPPLNVKMTGVRLPVKAITRIKALVGETGMAAFVREAVERELERREIEADEAKGKKKGP